jgi:hypothetical protein
VICQVCGVEAPTRKVFFVQHIGALVMFFHKRIGGMLCRTCAARYFRQYTLTTMFLGWWGFISLFATPVVLLINFVNYFRYRGMEPVPAGATMPQLTDDVVQRLQPLTQELIERLNRGEQIQALAADIGARAAATPGQVMRYVQALIEHSRRTAKKPT